jgi:type VI secretion system protein ImpE
MSSMTPQDCLREGQLAEALALTKNQIRSEPSVSRHRILLFQLSVVIGEWEKALNQLDVIAGLDAEALPMVQTYREAIRCEALRKQVFAGQRSPFLLGEPQAWVAWLIDALRLSAEGRHDEAQDLRERAFEQVEAVPGKIDDQAFQWIADADPRLGPVLEVIVNGRYYWVPFQRIRSIVIEPPADLRDMVWIPANFVWANGGDAVGLIPVRYPGSESQSDSRLQMARMTRWDELGSAGYLGWGQRQLCSDQGEFALLDIRRLEIFGAEEAAEADTASDA